MSLRSVAVPLVSGLLLAGCTSNDGGAEGSESPPTPSDATGSAPASLSEPGEVEYVPAPSDFLEAVEDAVAAGKYDEAEALALALEGALGLGPTINGLTAGDVVVPALTGLVHAAKAQLAGGDVPADQAERLEAALRHVSPTQDVLDAVSSPTAQAAGPRPGVNQPPAGPVVRPVRLTTAQGDGQECASIHTVGFYLEELGFAHADAGGVFCYLYIEDNSTGHRLRVYYPIAGDGRPDREPLAKQAMGALIKAKGTYGALTGVEMGAVNLVFSMRNTNGWYGVTGDIPSRDDRSSPCPISIFPLATADGRADEAFERTVAHELFHCAAEWMGSNWVRDRWWVEGAGEYFSNVVYPEANDEHKLDVHFAGKSSKLDKSLVELTYENVVFFQYYANKHGDDGLLTLLKALMASADPIGVLSGYPGMTGDWERFLVDYVAGEIPDTDPNGPHYKATVFAPPKWTNGTTPMTFATEPFVAKIHRLAYAQADSRYHHVVASGVQVSTVLRGDEGNLARWHNPLTGTLEHCGPWRLWVVPATSGTETAEISFTDIELHDCTVCPVTPAGASSALNATLVKPELPEGMEGDGNFSTFGIRNACVLDEMAEFPECGFEYVGDSPETIPIPCERDVSQLTVITLAEDRESFIPRAQASPDRVDVFDEPAIWINNGRGRVVSRFDGGEQYGDNLQELAVIAGPFVHIIKVEGRIVWEQGPEAVFEGMQTLVAQIVEFYETHLDVVDDGPGSDASPSAGEGSGAGNGGGGGGAGGGGAGGGAVDDPVLEATVTIDGAEQQFDIPDPGQPFWCNSAPPGFSIRLASSIHEGRFGIDDDAIEIEFPDESYSGRFDLGSAPGDLAVAHGDVLDVSYSGTLIIDSTRGGAEQTVDVDIAITCAQ